MVADLYPIINYMLEIFFVSASRNSHRVIFAHTISSGGHGHPKHHQIRRSAADSPQVEALPSVDNVLNVFQPGYRYLLLWRSRAASKEIGIRQYPVWKRWPLQPGTSKLRPAWSASHLNRKRDHLKRGRCWSDLPRIPQSIVPYIQVIVGSCLGASPE